MNDIEKSLESKSQSISDWWNCVPDLDKDGWSATLLVRLSDALEEIKKIKKDEYAKLMKDLEFDVLDSVSYEYGLKKGKEETEVRVREETARKIKNIINSEPIGNSKFVYIGNIINKINKSFLVKSGVQKE